MRLMTELFDGVKPDDGRKRSRDLPRKTSAADIYEDAGATSSALWSYGRKRLPRILRRVSLQTLCDIDDDDDDDGERFNA